MADICLLLEGTYPYVAGGVSTWVDQLVRRFRDLTFSILYLGPRRASQKKLHYEMPENIIEFREIYLFDYLVRNEKNRRARPADYETLFQFFVEMRKGNIMLFPELIRILGAHQTRTISLYELAHGQRMWKILERLYAREEHEISFLDYFWTWRFLFLPFFSLLRVELPRARLYHSISTGYAGILGAMGKIQNNRPFLLTEHGIYTRERKIEISRADWIFSEAADDVIVREGREFFREWWIQLFTFLSKSAYAWADQIITLFEGNRKIQIEEGAAAERTRVIPNGIDFYAFDNLNKIPRTQKCRVGFVGRVVPIKDVKTFIKACRIVSEKLPAAEFLIIGPWDEDEDYFRECQFLVESENLQHCVKFTGKANVKKYYPELDVLVLTSISEGQPIVILEAQASGVPVVATDVGACRELLEGKDPDDQLLGASGLITPVCAPEKTADAILQILTHPELHQKLSRAGKLRSEIYYQMDDLVANYRSLYEHHLHDVGL